MVVPREQSVEPWHAAGSANADPADAVREFAAFIGFGEGFALGELQQGDSRSGEMEIRPVGADSFGSPPEKQRSPIDRPVTAS